MELLEFQDLNPIGGSKQDITSMPGGKLSVQTTYKFVQIAFISVCSKKGVDVQLDLLRSPNNQFSFKTFQKSVWKIRLEKTDINS